MEESSHLYIKKIRGSRDDRPNRALNPLVYLDRR
jgi:hypothetical protein